MRKTFNVRTITLNALMAALVFVLTRLIQVPTPTRGYVHLGDVGVVFTALAFGPTVGAVAGGLGTALADLTSGYGMWAPFSLVIHGLQGYLLGRLAANHKRMTFPFILLITAVNIAVIAGGYLLAGLILVGNAALAEVPANAMQAFSGNLLGIPLYLLVQMAYPPIKRMAQ